MLMMFFFSVRPTIFYKQPEMNEKGEIGNSHDLEGKKEKKW